MCFTDNSITLVISHSTKLNIEYKNSILYIMYRISGLVMILSLEIRSLLSSLPPLKMVVQVGACVIIGVGISACGGGCLLLVL